MTMTMTIMKMTVYVEDTLCTIQYKLRFRRFEIQFTLQSTILE